jgi:glycosyltransferase involved in cell wall biosynthesis
MRILYVHATLAPPPVNQQSDRFFLLSEKLDGDVLQPVWFSKPEEVEAVFGPGSYPVHTVGRFRYHWFLASRYRWGARQRLAIFWFYVRQGLKVSRERHPACIVAYSHMTTGLMAGILKLLTGAKLIIEIATSPGQVYITDRPKPTWGDRLKHLYSDVCLHLSILLADRTHLLSPNQLSAYPLLRSARNSVFHEFVPLSIIQRSPEKDEAKPVVLLIGSPWYLKGVDLLIAAFRNLAQDFPGARLQLIGFFPDRAPLLALIGGCPQIEILGHMPHPEAMERIGQAAIMVLPSRCEGMGRVLIEGMAAGLPLIGSDVGGIPYMVHDGENGFVFPSGDAKALESRLRELLASPELRRRLGERGFERARHELTESVYVARFAQMVRDTVERNPSD